MKTKVEVQEDIHQEPLLKGDTGYIDGYVQAADGRPYAVVVVGEKIGLCMTPYLKVIGLLR